jgi:7,8-dihydro-6-hydroxymethylpterin-pyrophosphokinase
MFPLHTYININQRSSVESWPGKSTEMELKIPHVGVHEREFMLRPLTDTSKG